VKTMKKLFTAALCVTGAVLTIVGWHGIRSSQEDPPAIAESDADRQQIREFWQLFQEAHRYRSQGEHEHAARLYRECSQRNPRHEDSLFFLALSSQEIGEYQEAVAALRELLEQNPASSRALTQLGVLLSTPVPGAVLNFEEAKRLFEKAVELNREQSGPFLRLGLLHLNRGDLDSALRSLQTAANFGSPEGNLWLGYALLLKGQTMGARQRFEMVLEGYKKEKHLTGKGIRSEGDILPAPEKPLSALERAAILSMYFLRATEQMNIDPGAAAVPAETSGGAGAWMDADNDGRADLVVANRGRSLISYRWRPRGLEDATVLPGLSGIGQVGDVVAADFDGDGLTDLYFPCGGPRPAGRNLLCRNLGNGRFEKVHNGRGLEGERSSLRALFFDFDNDHRLDLLEVGAPGQGTPSVRLFRNRGDRWQEQALERGLFLEGTVVDAAVADYNGDGWLDLFLLPWRKPVRLYANRKGRFEDVTEQAGLKHVIGNGYSAAFFDYDRDDRPDLLITAHAPLEDVARAALQPDFHASPMHPRLFRNEGGGRFAEVTEEVGLRVYSGTLQAIAADLDGDRWTDVLLINGSWDAQRLEPTFALRNEGGQFFQVSPIDRLRYQQNLLGASVTDPDGDGILDAYLRKNPLTPIPNNRSPVIVKLALARQSGSN